MEDNKKMTAAIAAVMHYIQTEEEIIRMQAAMSARPQVLVSAPIPAAAPNPWGIHGRQTQMQMRHLMQMRTFQSKACV